MGSFRNCFLLVSEISSHDFVTHKDSFCLICPNFQGFNLIAKFFQGFGFNAQFYPFEAWQGGKYLFIVYSVADLSECDLLLKMYRKSE